MRNLIKALNILSKYERDFVTNCEYGTLYIGVMGKDVLEEDIGMLKRLGFYVDWDTGYFASRKYGGA